jgi:hypothetical protein
VKTRAFGKCDWDGFAGAEGWDGAGEPLIGECSIDGSEFAVVLDRSGVFASDGETDMFLRIPFVTQGAASVFAAGLPQTATRAELEKMGFAEV